MSTPIPGGNRFDVVVARPRRRRRARSTGIALPMPGRHNVQNALAAIGVAVELGIADDDDPRAASPSSAASSGASPRSARSTASTIIDDYGHHPVEIRAVLSAAREGATGRVIAVVQPHRFTRLRDLMDEFQGAFNDADIVLVAPVYAAGEAPIEGVDPTALVEGLKRARPSRRAGGRGRRRRSPAACATSPRRATWSSASAPATSPNGRRAGRRHRARRGTSRVSVGRRPLPPRCAAG